MNKLKEILEEFKQLEVMQCYCGNRSETPCFCETNFKEATEFLTKKIAKYAVADLEFAPDDMKKCCDNDMINSFEAAYSSKLDAYFSGYNAAVASRIDRIEQDISSLSNNA